MKKFHSKYFQNICTGIWEDTNKEVPITTIVLITSVFGHFALSIPTALQKQKTDKNSLGGLLFSWTFTLIASIGALIFLKLKK